MVLRFMQQGHAITHLDALRMFSCARLAARIDDLRKMGHIIITEDVTEGGKTFARYHLAKGK
jgi:hypothetical protein